MDIKLHTDILSRAGYSISNKYQAKLSVNATEKAIKEIKWTFQNLLAAKLSLEHVSAPLFVSAYTGINDTLSGTERAVSFDVKSGTTCQVVHSLAKWKRLALSRYNCKGLYTDMKAIRRDEDLSPFHSYYVDQWDWEAVIAKESRSIEMLKEFGAKIFSALKELEHYLAGKYPVLAKKLPQHIIFKTSQELEDLYPNLSPKERENEVCRKYKAVFLMQIGNQLKSGAIHDARAPDYDDWELNGDILVYHQELDLAFELSSMGIRVDSASLSRQLKATQNDDYRKYEFHQMILKDELPYTVGGGIGQSRVCMYFLDKIHIGEVQASFWPDEIHTLCADAGISLL